MMTSNFDTLKATKNLTGKTLFNKKQAEKLVETVANSQKNLITREYLDMKLDSLENRLENKIMNKLYIALIAQASFIIAVIKFL